MSSFSPPKKTWMNDTVRKNEVCSLERGQSLRAYVQINDDVCVCVRRVSMLLLYVCSGMYTCTHVHIMSCTRVDTHTRVRVYVVAARHTRRVFDYLLRVSQVLVHGRG